MSEVDYSQFLYREQKPSNEEKTVETKKKKPKKKFPWLGVIAFFICVAIVLLSVDFFGKGLISSSINELINGKKYVFYMLCSPHTTQTAATGQSVTATQGGAAGYVINDGEIYYVIYSIYTNKSDAEKVCEKNHRAGFIIREYSYNVKNPVLADKIYDFVINFNKQITYYETGAVTDSALYAFLRKSSEEFSTVELASEEEKTLITFIKQSVDGIMPLRPNRADNLASLRSFIAALVISANAVYS